ncbi:MAG TPA: ParB/RepB/Spo0J family partition protein [Gemmatimonadaceae bacterium]|jgi:ParB family chromosome partitioning protein
MADKPRLGKGLGALLSAAQERAPAEAPASDLQVIPLSRIRPNPFQPRRTFNPEELAELEASLKATGLLQPISVRRQGDAFELVAGERRLRAATNLGWKDILAVVREFDDQTMLVLALVENLQRANLNAIEEARGYKRLLEEFQLTQQQVADAVGKDRTTITNLLRVLSLPDSIQRMVEHGELTTGHARALLALPPVHSALDLAKRVVVERLSVREVEQIVREMSGLHSSPSDIAKPSASKQTSSPPKDPAVRRLEDDLRKHLQTDVRVVVDREEKGRIELSFYSNEDLSRIIEVITGGKNLDF